MGNGRETAEEKGGENQRVSASCKGTKSNVWPREGNQAARAAARETAAGSPQGETSGSERVN